MHYNPTAMFYASPPWRVLSQTNDIYFLGAGVCESHVNFIGCNSPQTSRTSDSALPATFHLEQVWSCCLVNSMCTDTGHRTHQGIVIPSLLLSQQPPKLVPLKQDKVFQTQGVESLCWNTLGPLHNQKPSKIHQTLNLMNPSVRLQVADIIGVTIPILNCWTKIESAWNWRHKNLLNLLGFHHPRSFYS